MKKCIWERPVKTRLGEYNWCKWYKASRKCKNDCPHMKKTFMWKLFRKDGE